MRNLTLTVCFLLFSIQLITAQSQGVVWKKCFGGTAKDIATDVLLNSDGTMVVAGYSHSTNGNVTGHHGDSTTSDGWVIKLDTTGNLLWQKSVGGTANDFLNTVISTGDGGYLCTGYTYSNDGDVTGNHGMADLWAVKLNAGGSLVWSKCYGGTKVDTAADAVMLHDGQFALLGSTFSVDGNVLTGPSVNNTASDAWVIKLNKTDGNLLWERVINYQDSTLDDGGLNIAESNNNSIVVFLCVGFEVTFWSSDQWNTETRYKGVTYELNETTGSAAFFSATGASAGWKEPMVMYKSNNGYNFIYDAATFATSPFNCFSYTRGWEIQGFNGITSKTFGETQDCHLFQWARPESDISQAHGMIVSRAGKFISVGQAPDDPSWQPSPIRAYISNIGGISYDYSDDCFFSIKELAAEDEFIVVGYTNSGKLINDINFQNAPDYHSKSDFWVLKYQSLNTIKANFFIDYNNNNIKDAGEPPFNRAVAKTINQNGSTSRWAYPVNGLAETTVDIGTFKTAASLYRPYYSVSTDTTITTFTTYKNTATINYPVHPIPGSRDYTIYITPASAIRPGFDVYYGLTYSNAAIDTLINKQVKFVKDIRLQFVSSAPAPTSVVGDTITWNIARLIPDSTGNISVHLQAALLPVLQLGDTVSASAYIDSTGDLIKYNNVSTSVQTVTGSYDPNDKQENYGGAMQLSDAAAGNYLTYTIRFQNTGNDTAFNIIVRDTLSGLLDSTSFEMINTSHDYKVSIINGKYITWKFNDIKLLDSTHNEPLSHGYISYRIKPKLPIGIGDVIQNSAAIYFDYNPPVITNTSRTEIKGTPTSTLWTGAVSIAWEDPMNWSNGKVPDVNTIVTIPASVPNYPEISSNATCFRISVMPTATVMVKTGFKLQVNAKN